MTNINFVDNSNNSDNSDLGVWVDKVDYTYDKSKERKMYYSYKTRNITDKEWEDLEDQIIVSCETNEKIKIKYFKYMFSMARAVKEENKDYETYLNEWMEFVMPRLTVADIDMNSVLNRHKKIMSEVIYQSEKYGIFSFLASNAVIKFTTAIKTAAVRINRELKIEIMFNPVLYSFVSDDENRATLLHELLHIIFRHTTKRLQSKQGYKPNIAKLAADIALNQYLQGMKPYVCTPEHWAIGKPNLPQGLDAEEYYNIILQLQDKAKNKGDDINDNDEFDYQDDDHDYIDTVPDTTSNAVITDLLKKGVEKALKSSGVWGNTPQAIQEYLLNLLNGKQQVDWKKYLRNFFQKLYGQVSTATWQVVNNELPGYLEGVKRSPNYPKVLFAFDQSGSVSDQELVTGLTELYGVSKLTELYAIVFDDTVDEDSLMHIKSLADAKRFKRTRCGGTNFQPISDYAEKNGYSCLIILTDMEAYKPSDTKKTKRIWLTTKTVFFETKETVITVDLQY